MTSTDLSQHWGPRITWLILWGDSVNQSSITEKLVSNSYNTSTRAVSDLQSRHPRARSARGWSDCKSDTARVGVL